MAQSDPANSDIRSLIPAERRRQIEQLIRETGSLTVAMLEEKFEISPMTVRRDLDALEREGKLRRTHGGAVLLGFAAHEDSFRHRLDQAVGEKRLLAQSAVEMLEAGETIFVDSSTTTYYLAQQVLAEGLRLTLLTNSVPVMELFMRNDAPNVNVVGTGGALRKLTLSFVGPHAVRTVLSHFADKVFLSVKGIAPEGYLADPDTLEAEVKRAMLERSGTRILLADASKFDRRGFSIIAPVSNLTYALTTGTQEVHTNILTEAGVEVRRV